MARISFENGRRPRYTPLHLQLIFIRRGARVAEWTRLESGRPRKGTVGSNPTLSAKQSLLTSEHSLVLLQTERKPSEDSHRFCAFSPKIRRNSTIANVSRLQ